MIYVYSKSQNAFYPVSLQESYELAGGWPADGVNISSGDFEKYTAPPPEGKCRVAGKDGLPEWKEIPPPGKEVLINLALNEIKYKVDCVNIYINSKQWPGKAAIGRLNSHELVQYNLWLDYLDALEAVDVSNAPDINWPDKPVE
ncbi:Caudovirales tail fibre assembly protein [Cedecea davisae]|uniref:Caudovirales tail fiber assembly protein n=1 Tax=Cedecea davisae DSM 4568 TaxID=566551 RepID=S3IRT3_9ENTR|nr:tail fiber assembly protein [Cedecea davisae]EPF15291.1 caudovirales tail fiber assembly protein [Cedecea davisae DSM 4568]SUX38133.1 Caudovirales tail fibre assembly protein [Cedecea davisae]